MSRKTLTILLLYVGLTFPSCCSNNFVPLGKNSSIPPRNRLTENSSKFSDYNFTLKHYKLTTPITDSERVQWNNSVKPLLVDSTWSSPYNTGHILMVPLYVSFLSKEKDWLSDFDNYFREFTKSYPTSNLKNKPDKSPLAKLHFLYLASEYLALNKEANRPIPQQKLLNIIQAEFLSVWNLPAWQWERCPFKNMEKRLRWKLSNFSVKRTYYRAIIDEEMFTLAIGANLRFILQEESPEILNNSLDIAYEVLTKEVHFINTLGKKWLFQPGVWSDHRDYAYAGWDNNLSKLTSKRPVAGIAGDSSHAHRWPVWLISFQRGFQSRKQKQRVEYIRKLREGLAEQFTEIVLVPPTRQVPYYRTKNFMDGQNGVYRYDNHNDKDPTWRGYGSWELSGTMLLGWWSYLPDPSISKVYCNLASFYPERISKNILSKLPTYTVKGRENPLKLINKLACATLYIP
ncbi:hypothetical protein [Sphaerospermopsis reniformis]|nr:hypothetical protein [Sphaerospermopsis reniformis]